MTKKTIVKEIGIVLLLILAIGLILAILLYDYIPNNKAVPIKIQAYNMAEDVKEELNGTTLEEQNIVRTYYIDSTDLNLYESTNEYDKGKANPFADYSEQSNTSTTSNSSTNTSSSNKTTTNSTSSSSSSSKNNSTEQNTTNSKNEEYMTTPGKNY